MRKKYKGMTVVEVVVSFALISLSLAIGMAGIACGANFINAGARLKNHDRQTVVREIKGIATANSVPVKITDSAGNAQTINVDERQMNGFKWYSTGGGMP